MNRRQKLVQEHFLHNEEQIIKRLQAVYGQSLKDINAKIKELEFSIDGLTEQYDWMDDDDPKKATVKSKIQSKIYQKQYQEQLQRQVDGILSQMQTKQYLNVSDYLDGCYTDGFLGTVFDMHGQGVPLMMPLDQEAMVRAVQTESKISKGLYTRLGEDVNLLKRKITAQVSRAISSGMSFAQTAQQLAGYTRVGFNNAVRITRTEGHRIQCTAAMDACHQAKDRGADVVKQWDAALDARTRESHAAVDGEIRELDEAFSNGLQYPGDPAGGAAEVVNCRCALLQRARWALGDAFTKRNNFTKQLEDFEGPGVYDGFKKAFFSDENQRYMAHVEGMWSKYETKDFPKLLSAMTDKEYDLLSMLTVQNPIYNKKGLEQLADGGIIRLGVVRDAITSGSVSTRINTQKQNRHIATSAEFTEGRSRLTVSLDEAQKIVDELKGTGEPIFDTNGEWTRKERIVCSDVVGVHVDVETGVETKTKKLTLIYSGTGTHLVPRRDD